MNGITKRKSMARPQQGGRAGGQTTATTEEGEGNKGFSAAPKGGAVR